MLHPYEAWQWVQTCAEEALEGDKLSLKLLPNVITHWMRIRLDDRT